jgi:hypothetical protein
MPRAEDKPSGRPTPAAIELPAFDPNPPARFGYDVLTEAGARFALIGQVAMWVLLRPAEHELTKDVDFAVPASAVEPLRPCGRSSRAGGSRRARSPSAASPCATARSASTSSTDEGGPGGLYEEAIAKAERSGGRAEVEGASIPVVTLEYLVALQVAAAEERDQEHAVRLLRALPDLDLRRAREILTRHGSPVGANLLDVLARKAGRPDARPEYRNSGWSARARSSRGRVLRKLTQRSTS